jgi:hypothetical protein
MRDDPQQPLFPAPAPPARPVATPEDRAALLARLRERRRQLIDSYVTGLDPEAPVSPSAVQPLAIVQAAITAVEAVRGEQGQ